MGRNGKKDETRVSATVRTAVVDGKEKLLCSGGIRITHLFGFGFGNKSILGASVSHVGPVLGKQDRADLGYYSTKEI